MDVFVSYSSKDEAIANELYQLLEQNGIRPWIAVADAAHGKSYAASIIEAINNAPVMLLVLSQAAVDSPHVLNEVNYAFNHGKTILPVVVGQVTLTDGLEYYLGAQNLLIYASNEAFHNNLLTTVNQALNKGQGAARPMVITGGTYQPPKKRFPWPILLLMAVVGLLVGSLMAVLPYLNPAADPAPGSDTSVTTPTSDTTEPSESATTPTESTTTPTESTPSSTTPTESTPAPTTPSQALDLDAIPESFRGQVKNGISTGTVSIKVGDADLPYIWTGMSIDLYTANAAIASTEDGVIHGVSVGETYVVITHKGSNNGFVYKVIVTE